LIWTFDNFLRLIINKINGFEISKHKKPKKVINIKIKDEILDKLIFPFNKFDISTLEYKSFTRFTIAKSLDDLTNNKMNDLINSIIRGRNTGYLIMGQKILIQKLMIHS